MDVDKMVSILRNQPSSEIVESILDQVPHITNQVSMMKIVTALLNHTVPELYNDLSNYQQSKLKNVFQTLVGLGNLVGKIVGLKEMKNPDLELLKIYLQVLGYLLDDKLIIMLYKTKKTILESKEIDKLLFKGKIYSIVSEVCMKYHIEMEIDVMKNTVHYVNYICHGIIMLIKSQANVRFVNSSILSINSFNPDSMYPFFEMVFNEDNWDKFYHYFESMKPFERKKILLGLFDYCKKRYLVEGVDEEKIYALGSALSFASDLIDTSLIEYIISSNNKYLCIVMAIVLSSLSYSKLNELIIRALDTWGDEMVIKSEPIGRQEIRTYFLLQLLFHKKNTIFIKELTRDSVFLNSITNRLNSLSNNVKMLGVILSDKICELSQQEKIFSFENSGEFPELYNCNPIDIELYSGEVKSIWNTLNKPVIIEAEIEEISESLVNLPMEIQNTPVVDIDSDDESNDDDDPSVSRIPKVAKPLYIKDLLEYLSVDPKKSQAYDMRKVALAIGPTLIRQKFKFGNEMKFYSESLLQELVGMTNYYEQTNFEELRINCIIAILVANPTSTLYLYNLLLTGDYSLQQRMSILTASSLAARELRGFRDESVTKNYKEINFPSNILPSGAHEIFSRIDNGNSMIDKIQSSIQDDLMYEASENAKKELGGGNIIRISNKLKKKQINPATEVPKIKDFSKIIGSHFYFPLINVWHESGGIDIGHYSPILASHFIKTLGLILHAAYPIAVNLNDMVNDLLQIVIPLTKRIKIDELQLYEAVVTGVLLICDMMDEQYLMENYANEITILQKWLSNSWELIIDDRIKSLCAGLLIRISNMMENFERLIINQTNAFY